MRSFPAHLLEQLPLLRWTDFDPASELALAFRQVPPSKGVNRYHKGRTPLGWVMQDISQYRTSNRTIAWVDFLLSAGANPALPVVKRAPPLSPSTLSQAVLASQSPALLEVLERHGVDVLAPLGPATPFYHRPSLTAVLGWGNVDLLKRFSRCHRLWPAEKIMGPMLRMWQSKPSLAAQGAVLLLDEGEEWTAQDVPSLWMMALRDPTGPWLGWAKDQHAKFPLPFLSSDNQAQWRISLGFLLTYELAPGLPQVRAALEALVDPDHRSALSPLLPSVLKTLGVQEWRGVAALVDWAVDWKVPTSTRTQDGDPWTWWMVRQAHDTCDKGSFSHASGCEQIAWACLERLIRGGHRPNLQIKRKPGTSLGTSDAFGRSADGVLNTPWNQLSFHMKEWPARYDRLKKSLAFERALDRRMGKDGVTVAPGRPTRRF